MRPKFYNPCADGFAAKAWECLRRNKKFKEALGGYPEYDRYGEACGWYCNTDITDDMLPFHREALVMLNGYDPALAESNWLSDSDISQSWKMLPEEFRNRLDDALMRHGAVRLNQITAWRRSITINGPRNDTQSDICPEMLRDGLISIDGVTENSISLAMRFHVYPKFDSIKIGIGTQITPYKYKKDKDEYANAHPQDMQKTADAVLSLRTSLIAELEKAGVSNTKSAKTKKTAWFKEYAPRQFTKLNRVDEILEYGQNLTLVIIATLQQYSR